MSWPTVALGDVFDVERGGSPRPINDFLTDDNNGLNWVMISDATASGKVINSTKKKIRPEGLKKTRQVYPGDFILSNSMSFGRPYIMGIEGCIHDGWLLMRPRDERVDPDYFYHLLGSSDVYNSFASRAAGATVKNLNSGIVREVTIPLPPLEEQKRIAGILDQADALRRLRTRALDKLGTLGQAIFHEMFGDPLKERRNSPDWTLETLDDSISYIDYRGKTPPKAPDGVRLITAKNVKMGYINPEPMEFILEEAFEGWMTRGFPKKGDVLFTTEAPLGNVAILDSDQTLAVGQRLLTMQPDHSKIASEYLAFYLRTPEFTKRMIENSSGSTVRGIKSKLLKKIQICYPSLQRQVDFAEALHTHNINISTFENAAQHSQALFASLQHRAFRGEL